MRAPSGSARRLPRGRTLNRRGRSWSVYLLRCSDGTLYAGATADLARRVRQHQAGRASRYTRSRLPVALVYSERARDRSAALRREHALKRLSRVEKLALARRSTDRSDRAGKTRG